MSVLFISGRLKQDEARLRATLRAAIEGVTFDLTADGVSPADWICPRLLTEAIAGHPGFWFASGMGLGATGRIILNPGDHVRVGSVERAHAADPLRHAADQETLVIHLVVERAAGAAEPAGAVIMHPRGRLAEAPSAWAALAARMREDDPDLASLRKEAEGFRAELHAEFAKAWSPAPEGQMGLVGVSQYDFTAWKLDKLLNAAALAGYRQAQLEAQRDMEPLARTRLCQSAKARRGAQAAAKVKTDRWQGEVIKVATEVHRKAPKLSAEAVVQRVEERCRGKVQGLPAHEQLVKFIRKERRLGGRLPPREK